MDSVGCSLAGAGDFTCQLLGITLPREVDMDDETYVDMDKGVPPWQVLSVISDVDWARCARFAALGAGFLAPSLHYWYGFLGRRFPGLSVTAVAKRVALDQLAFTPVFVAAFLSLAMLIDGQAAKVSEHKPWASSPPWRFQSIPKGLKSVVRSMLASYPSVQSLGSPSPVDAVGWTNTCFREQVGAPPGRYQAR